ncbi:hypothetical protein [Endozoicomonas lisbonensis]|uniref:Tail fiber protein n=1 Tax=Endozoicomonas lisbonensis TaxID=3120522 RepID=A0ABV2SED7_9GAMM
MYENYVTLTDSSKIHDTTLLKGANLIDAGTSSQSIGAQKYFSGYVFSASVQPPEVVFEQGLMFTPRVGGADRVSRLVHASSGSARFHKGGAGVSTTICSHVAGWFLYDSIGYVYLINASSFRGFAAPGAPQSALYGFHNHLLDKVCDVNFTHPIFNNFIVGVVWPSNRQTPMEGGWYGGPPSTLKLAVNPNYEETSASDSIEAIVKLFSEDEW